MRFCGHVTGSHEDTVWSLRHQFNDVPDFLFFVFDIIVKERKPPNASARADASSLGCRSHSQERGDLMMHMFS